MKEKGLFRKSFFFFSKHCMDRVENLDLVRDAIEDVTFENLYVELKASVCFETGEGIQR